MDWIFVLRALANVTAAMAFFITIYANAGSFGFLLSGSAEGFAAGIAQILLTVVGFTGPVLTLRASDHPVALVGAIGVNLLIVSGTILIGIPAGDYIADIVFRIIRLQSSSYQP